MTDGRTEEGRTVLLGYGEQRKLRFEVDKLLDNHFLDITATAFHGVFESLFQFIIIMNITLSVS